MAETKSYGKHHDAILLLIGFVLTTGVGATVTTCYQQREWDRQDEINERRLVTSKAEGVYEQVSKMWDQRLYQTRMLNSAKYRNRNNSAEIALIEDDFQPMLDDWNSQINFTLTSLVTHFGDTVASFYDKRIGARFRSLYKKIDETNYAQNPNEYHKIKAEIDKLNITVSWLNIRMARTLREEYVGKFIHKGDTNTIFYKYK